jgi:nucleoside 2-deoxyribosyltransferase
MAIIYLAGPIDFGTNDSEDRQDFLSSIADKAIVYDATTTFVAPNVRDMTMKDMGGAIAIHHAAIEASDIFVADLRKRTVGIPIEMWLAHELQKPIFVLYDADLPASLYIDYVVTEYAYSWGEMLQMVEHEIATAVLA